MKKTKKLQEYPAEKDTVKRVGKLSGTAHRTMVSNLMSRLKQLDKSTNN